MAQHIRHAAKDLVLCRRQPGTAVGKLCDNCEGRCVICGTFANVEEVPACVCTECSAGALANKCVACGGGRGAHDAYYCRECALLERDRDGCPRVMTTSNRQRDAHYKLTTSS